MLAKVLTHPYPTPLLSQIRMCTAASHSSVKVSRSYQVPAYPAINRLGLFAASRPKGSSARKIVCIYPHITPQTNVTVHILRPKNPDITPDRIALPGDPLNRGKHRDIMRSCNV